MIHSTSLSTTAYCVPLICVSATILVALEAIAILGFIHTFHGLNTLGSSLIALSGLPFCLSICCLKIQHSKKIKEIDWANKKEQVELLTSSSSQPEYLPVANCIQRNNTPLKENQYWKTFCKTNPNETLYPEITEKVSYLDYFKASNQDNIVVPNHSALNLRAKHYQEKYGINIYVIKTNSLISLLESIQTEEAKYVGIIVGDKVSQYTTSHVTPLLLYLPGKNSKDKMECLVLDCLGQDYGHVETLQKYGLKKEKIWLTTRVRQSDQNSCRTGAITLLRNALLSLKYHKYEKGFTKVLQEGEVDGQSITILPPEWDYTEQFTNKKLNQNHLAIASCFHKGKKPELAITHRLRYSKSLSFQCEAHINNVSLNFDSTIPSGFDLEFNEYCCSFKFSVERSVNCYLLTKGKKALEKKETK